MTMIIKLGRKDARTNASGVDVGGSRSSTSDKVGGKEAQGEVVVRRINCEEKQHAGR